MKSLYTNNGTRLREEERILMLTLCQKRGHYK